ncbi:hypothetical protein EV183_000078 [Coemansia sp. RSA 2336]|nr:hypothetical protein EV183_000078 [Coemansia sp. RSA 2336]
MAALVSAWTEAMRIGSRLKQRSRRRHQQRRAASLAQYLPSSILQRIAYFVSATDGYSHDKSGSSRSSDDRLSRASHAMVGVCRSWRVAVLALFYRQYTLDVNCTAMWLSPYRKMVGSAVPDINDCVKQLAQSVHITVPFAGVFTGKVVQILDANGYSDAVFPKVHSLWLNFYAGTTVPIEEIKDAGFYIEQFTKYLTALFPGAAHYHLQVSVFTDSDDSVMVGNLLNALISSARHPHHTIEYVHSSSGVRISGLADVSGLTHIVIQDDIDPADCLNLVRRNAATLVAADLASVDAPDYLPKLATDDNGDLVVFPRLCSLSINGKLIPDDTLLAFPALKTLHRSTGKLCVANANTP